MPQEGECSKLFLKPTEVNLPFIFGNLHLYRDHYQESTLKDGYERDVSVKNTFKFL